MEYPDFGQRVSTSTDSPMSRSVLLARLNSLIVLALIVTEAIVTPSSELLKSALLSLRK
jgi:hypothetical protein